LRFHVEDCENFHDQTRGSATLSQARYGLAATSVGNLVLFGGGYYSFNNPSKVVDMGESKNSLTTILKKIGRLDKIIVFIVLLIVMILVCDFLVIL
jgi:hypothetical protein